MKNIVVRIQNRLLAESIVFALQKTGDFRPFKVTPERQEDAAMTATAANADILLMEVTRAAGSTLENRIDTSRLVRESLPACKIALLCDENSDPASAHKIKELKQLGLIDAFFYSDVTASYLTAALDSL